jgi:transposase
MGSGFVLRVDYARWGGTAEDLRHLALSAPHARTRERALALYEITQGSCATRVAACTGRHPQTVMDWVHAYNERGPDALVFRRTGGRPPFARRSQRRFVRPSAPPSAGQPLRP